MLRPLLIACRAAAFVVLVATLAFWYRSRHAGDCLRSGTLDLEHHSTTWTRILSQNGVIEIVRDRLQLTSPDTIRPDRLKAALPLGTRMIWSPASDAIIITPRTPSFWERMDIAYDSISQTQTQGMTPSAVTARNDRTCILFPIWPIAALSAAIALSTLSPLLKRRKQRRRLALEHCIHCNYDLRASTGRCPECGQLQAQTLPSPRYVSHFVIAGLVAIVGVAGGWTATTTSVFNDIEKENVTWLDLGRNDEDAPQKKALTTMPFKLRPVRKWFKSTQIVVTKLEQDRFTFRRDEGQVRYLYSSLGPPTLDTLPCVLLPGEIPTEDQGISLSLKLSPKTEANQLSMEIELTNSVHPAGLQMNVYDANPLPFLFAISVDDHPIVVPAMQQLVQSERSSSQTLVEATETRKWALKVDEKSLRQFLPDALPHSIEIYASFSNEQYDSNVPQYLRSQRVLQLHQMRHTSDPQLLVRSNPAKLQWTGQTWKAVNP